MGAQEIIVALIVLAALLRVVWKYLPASWRARLGQRPGAADGGGCHGCDGCGSTGRAKNPECAE
jgi:hypothetical protein